MREFFNALNRQNPAAVGRQEGWHSSLSASRYKSCPDRGQIGFRIDF